MTVTMTTTENEAWKERQNKNDEERRKGEIQGKGGKRKKRKSQQDHVEQRKCRWYGFFTFFFLVFSTLLEIVG